jgi:hypothetical protein
MDLGSRFLNIRQKRELIGSADDGQGRHRNKPWQENEVQIHSYQILTRNPIYGLFFTFEIR